MSNGYFLTILILLLVSCFMSSAIGITATHYSASNDSNTSNISSQTDFERNRVIDFMERHQDDRQKTLESLNTSMGNMTLPMNRTSNGTASTNATNAFAELKRDLPAETPKASITASIPCRIEPNSTYSLVGFRSLNDIDTYIPMLEDRNFTAAEKFLNETDRKFVFKSGDEVYIDNDLFGDEIKVRKPGETETWWIIKDAVICP